MSGTSLVAQWLRIHLPVQGAWVWSLVWENPTCHGTTKSVHHNYWACALEPMSHNYWAHALQILKSVHSRACVPQLLSIHAATTEAHKPKPHAPQQEKPPQWENQHTTMKSSPHLSQLEKAHAEQQRPNAAKKKKVKKIFFKNHTK